MDAFHKHFPLLDACKIMRYNANLYPWNGKDQIPEKCRWFFERYPATLVFTKEYGYHTGGWWKNPGYERCWHLSISFRGGSEKKALAQILENLFAPNQNLLWVESPVTKEGKSLDVWHYRLFCDENWFPIKPR